jgi:hypothetical protein
VILLRNLGRERHTGQTKDRRTAMATFDDFGKMKSHRPPL